MPFFCMLCFLLSCLYLRGEQSSRPQCSCLLGVSFLATANVTGSAMIKYNDCDPYVTKALVLIQNQNYLQY